MSVELVQLTDSSNSNKSDDVNSPPTPSNALIDSSASSSGEPRLQAPMPRPTPLQAARVYAKHQIRSRSAIAICALGSPGFLCVVIILLLATSISHPCQVEQTYCDSIDCDRYDAQRQSSIICHPDYEFFTNEIDPIWSKSCQTIYTADIDLDFLAFEQNTFLSFNYSFDNFDFNYSNNNVSMAIDNSNFDNIIQETVSVVTKMDYDYGVKPTCPFSKSAILDSCRIDCDFNVTKAAKLFQSANDSLFIFVSYCQIATCQYDNQTLKFQIGNDTNIEPLWRKSDLYCIRYELAKDIGHLEICFDRKHDKNASLYQYSSNFINFMFHNDTSYFYQSCERTTINLNAINDSLDIMYCTSKSLQVYDLKYQIFAEGALIASGAIGSIGVISLFVLLIMSAKIVSRFHINKHCCSGVEICYMSFVWLGIVIGIMLIILNVGFAAAASIGAWILLWSGLVALVAGCALSKK